ncbi:MAG: DUF2064 domain-containing protein [Thermoanaerobaculia bacterium]|nr:DUF2064 domain-containing protein [Thermoanaerobaculia bacterium]
MAYNSRIRRAVVLFTGNPRVEERQKHLPARFLSTLHRELRSTIERMAGVDLVVASEDAGGFRVDCDGTTSRLVNGAEGGLAARVELAFNAAFAAGYDSVVVLAGDILGLRRETLEQSFERLEETDGSCVLGPSGDGGFYLAGLRSGTSFDWSSIPWRSSDVSIAFCASAVEAGLVVRIVERLDDVDSLADAVRLTDSLHPAFHELRRALRSLLSVGLHAIPARARIERCSRGMARQLRAPPAA